MAAINAAVLAHTVSGDHLIVDTNAYGGTRSLCEIDFPRYGLTVDFVDLTDHAAVSRALTDRTRVVLAEALSNPTLRVPDIERLAEITPDGALLLVDATFLSPALTQPLTHGAALSVHSIAKYIGGHSVALGGVVSGARPVIDPVRAWTIRHGSTIDPFNAWLALLGIKTLPLRMTAHNANAVALAHELLDHPSVAKVHHPAVPTHTDRATAHRLYPHGTGGMLSVELVGGLESARRLIDALAGHVPFAPSLGDVATTVAHPATSSHRHIDPALRSALGITDGLIRLSVGIETIADITRDVGVALDAAL